MNEKGFSLMELLITTLLITLFLLPLLTLLHKEVTFSRSLHIFQIALSLAEEEMEEVLDTSLLEREVRDRRREIQIGNHSFRVERDVIDGKGKDETPLGSDPLEVWVRVYHGQGESPVARLVTLKEDWR